MGGLDTLELDKKLRMSNFLGAYAFDELPANPGSNFSVIVNTQSSSEPGEHWIPLILKNGIFYFIDSYGRSPLNSLFSKDFRNAIKEYFKGYKYKYNPRMIQDIFSNTCGYYSIYFIHEMEHKSMKSSLSIFGIDFRKNDILVKEIVNLF